MHSGKLKVIIQQLPCSGQKDIKFQIGIVDLVIKLREGDEKYYTHKSSG
jgi:hypothetical protein